VNASPTISRRAHGEDGTTLLEVLIAIMLLAIGGVTILAGLATAIRGSDTHQRQVQVDLALISAAERLKDPAVIRVPCATIATAPYLAAVRTAELPPGWDPVTTVRITAVRYSDGATFGTTCLDTDLLRHHLTTQLVTITITSPDGRASESIVVAKGAAL
jgi:hypothetical protein